MPRKAPNHEQNPSSFPQVFSRVSSEKNDFSPPFSFYFSSLSLSQSRPFILSVSFPLLYADIRKQVEKCYIALFIAYQQIVNVISNFEKAIIQRIKSISIISLAVRSFSKRRMVTCRQRRIVITKTFLSGKVL